MKGILKDSCILFAITIVAGFLLGYVYDITKEPIARQQQITKDNACKAVFEDATSFEDFYSSEMTGSDAYASTSYAGGDITEALLAKDANGNALGLVITTTDHNGYGGDVTFLMGVRLDGTINGISFLSLNETAGLGMKAKNPEFKDQFAGMNSRKIRFTKSGKSAEDEIDAISAATITTTAVTNAVNGGLDFFYDNQAIIEANVGGAN